MGVAGGDVAGLGVTTREVTGTKRAMVVGIGWCLGDKKDMNPHRPRFLAWNSGNTN